MHENSHSRLAVASSLLIPRLLACSFAACLTAAAHESKPPWQQPTDWPDRIVSSPGADTTKTLTVTWRTDSSVGTSIAQIVKASADARFDISAKATKARTQALQLDALECPQGLASRHHNHGLGCVHYHSVEFTGLVPGTKYAWRVRGAPGKWSEWHQTQTLPDQGPVSFVYFGDAQNGIRSHWSRVIREANTVAPDANFFLHAGDLVNKGDLDRDWAEWFAAGSYLHASVPCIPVAGNHEYIPVADPNGGKKKRVLTPLWRSQFTLPIVESLPEELHEAVYDLRCGDMLHLFVLNSAPSDFQVQARWLDEQLNATNATWRIVTMHHPYFVPMHSKRLGDNLERMGAFADVVKKHKVDMVIVGHIHTYSRASRPRDVDDQPARHASGTPQDVETMFVISSSGAKVGKVGDEDWVSENVGDGRPEPGLSGISVERVASNTPMFQVIRIDGPTLEFTAHTAVGDTYDRFILTKSGERKMLTNGKESFGPTRLFENTGVYPGWEDLQ